MSQNAIIHMKGKLYRAHLMPNGDWFCIDHGFVIQGLPEVLKKAAGFRG